MAETQWRDAQSITAEEIEGLRNQSQENLRTLRDVREMLNRASVMLMVVKRETDVACDMTDTFRRRFPTSCFATRKRHKQH
jgi:hypothetical protein